MIRVSRCSFLLCVCVFLPFTPLFAQTIISAQITDSLGNEIPDVSITYKAKNAAAIMGYVRSGTDGRFRLQIQAKTDSILLTLSHLGYGRIDTMLSNKTSEYKFRLSSKSQVLKEVEIGPPPIYKKQDTLNFQIESFVSKQDRVIADVIQKLPGIEMEGDRILYQGRPIQKYMVNNLDLMEGRYGMINNSLPADAVKKIQIVENDQPIKILDSLVFSDRASLNIELKKFTTTGSGKVGIGYKPALWDVNLTPMTFNKTFQSVQSVQSNNTGNDVSKQLHSYYLDGGNVINSLGAVITPGESFMKLQNIAVPEFEERKWMDNRIFLGSSNILVKLKDDLQIKANISYYDDMQKREGYTFTQIFTPGQEVSISESINNRYDINNLRLGMVLEKNEKTIFLKNDLQFQRRWEDDDGRLLFNDADQIQQNKVFRDFGIANKLSISKFIAKQLVSFNSSVTYGETPQRLIVRPGQFANILNNDEPYDALRQDVSLKQFNTENSLSFSRKIGAFLITPRIGVDYQRDHLGSHIQLDGKQSERRDDFVNDQSTDHFQISLDPFMQFERKRWKLTLQTPYVLHIFNGRQLESAVLDGETRGTFNPRGTARLSVGEKTEFTYSSSYKTQFGDLTSLYNAYIVTTYRDIQRYLFHLRRTNSWNNSIYYKYADVMKGIFANLTYHYNQNKNNFIFQNTIDSNGLRTLSLLNRNSRNWSHGLSGNASKLFSDINTIMKINGTLAFGESDYLLNEQFGQQKNANYGLGIDLNNNSYELLSLHYKGNWGTFSNRLADGSRYRVTTIRQDMNFTLYPVKNHSITWNNSYYITNASGQKNQIFIDLMYRWVLEKAKMDIEISGINILNNNEYIQRFNADYAVVESYFNLRPRQFLISSRFKF
ncbi:TonB-dependent receptor [Olivibacter domesticus]|uniref:CarboxypepD_reg-like domain-containing protein n=1 Tax=Olivibacter domesticus TaxID=407022 RepID=A0A1H7JQA4_OLID1|nr:hypothetical protein [Olivibacter domesticus]SEK76868.1 hypothetical protein SAMN05661044_01098 [Olivibacter domesticus]